MKHRQVFGLGPLCKALFFVLVAHAVSLPAVAQSTNGALPFVPYEAIVKLKSGASIPDIEGVAFYNLAPTRRTYLATAVDQKQLLGVVDEAATTLSMIAQLGTRNDVEFVHANYVGRPASDPSDTYFNLQWSLHDMDWSGYFGFGDSNVRIAIIDTGWTGHPDIQWSTLRYDATTGQEWQAVGPNQNVGRDAYYYTHGTHVASVIGARTNNGMGVAGICPDCSLVPVLALPNGQAETVEKGIDDFIRGIDWAISKDVRVINMSLEIPGIPCSAAQGLGEAIRAAIGQGANVVAAAGNDGVDASMTSPASCPGVIAVVAVDQQKMRGAYSNFGGNVALAAPGGGGTTDDSLRGAKIDDCPSTTSKPFSDNTSGIPGAWTDIIIYNGVGVESGKYCYRYLSGTSLATAHVSGAIGLLASIYPQMDTLEAYYLLTHYAEPLPSCQGCGAGLLNVDNARTAAAYVASGWAVSQNCRNTPSSEFCQQP
jgi:subtilisin family serine protease